MALSQILNTLNLPDPIQGIRDIQSKFTVSNAFRLATKQIKKSPRDNITERKTATQVENRISQGGDIILAETKNFTIKAPIKDSIINIYNPRRVVMGEGGSEDQTTRAERREEELEARRSKVGGFAGLMGASAVTKKTRTIGGGGGDDDDKKGSVLSSLLSFGDIALDILGALAAGRLTLGPLLRRIPGANKIPFLKKLLGVTDDAAGRGARAATNVARRPTVTPSKTPGPPIGISDTSDVPRPPQNATQAAGSVVDDPAKLRADKALRLQKSLRNMGNLITKGLGKLTGPLGLGADLLAEFTRQQAVQLQKTNESLGRQMGQANPSFDMKKVNAEFNDRPRSDYHTWAANSLKKLRDADEVTSEKRRNAASIREKAKNTKNPSDRKRMEELAHMEEQNVKESEKVVADGLPPRLKFLDPSNPINTGEITGTLSDIIRYHEERANPMPGDSKHVGENRDISLIPKMTNKDIEFNAQMDLKRKIDPTIQNQIEQMDPFFQIEKGVKDLVSFVTPNLTPDEREFHSTFGTSDGAKVFAPITIKKETTVQDPPLRTRRSQNDYSDGILFK